MCADDLDPVWKALSDPTRRRILDYLREGPRITGEIVEQFPELSRVGVVKHIDVLRDAGLILVRKDGRRRINRLNPVPIRQIYNRWVRGFEGLWSGVLADLAEDLTG
ncbi:MAG: winged helix-turn-helix transcriptional regulator [Rhodothermales bacterium]|nr:winged helix-turn-helix transcriptional regulator [Rhodothermales bacterium]MBO6779251.1 winged helix-turn-helix transcriptional regulator [Rhodothermales bacterium]